MDAIRLADNQLKLLGELTQEALGSPEGINAKAFRFGYLKDEVRDIEDRIEELVHLQLVNHNRSKGTYRVTILGLLVQETELAHSLFHDVEKIFRMLRASYEREPRGETIPLVTLCDRLRLSCERVLECIKWIDELPDIVATNIGGEFIYSYVIPQEGAMKVPNAKEGALELLKVYRPGFLTAVSPEKTAALSKPKVAEKYSSQREHVLGAALVNRPAFRGGSLV